MATNLSLIADNRFSTILTEKENEIIFSLLGTNSKTLSTTLVRLLLSEAPDHRRWHISCIGIICLVKDFDSGMVFIKIFDFVEKTLLWEYQVANDIQYKYPEPLLLAFETSECLVGINFSVEEEAAHFIVTLKTELLKGKPQIDNSPQNQDKHVRKSLSKDDINSPTNFRHSLRVFFNPLVGFEVTKPNNKTIHNNLDNSSNEVFESEDEIQVENAFQFLRDDSIRSNYSNIESITDSKPVPKARTKVGNCAINSVGVQTEHLDTLYYALVNKFFEPVSHLTPPPIIKAMTYLASRPSVETG